MKKIHLAEIYTTLDGEKLDLSKLTKEEKQTLKKAIDFYNKGVNYLAFLGWMRNIVCPMLFQDKRWIINGKIEQSALYKIVNDLSKRLGIRQGYLNKCEVVKNCGHKHKKRREVGIDYIAKRLNCSHGSILNAIRTWKLCARNVRGKHLIWIKDANAFIKYYKEKIITYPE